MRSSREHADKSSHWVRSRTYKKAKQTVESVLQSPKRLLKLLERATLKSNRQSSGAISKSIDSVKVMVRLLTAYGKGDYQGAAFENLIKIAAALTYFVTPLDALPDFIVGLGLVDDAALLAWTFTAVKGEVERFLVWELEQNTDTEDGASLMSGRND